MECQQKAVEKELKNPSPTGQEPYSKCRTKYALVWAKLQAKAAGSGAICEGPRFVGNGDGTFTDNLTALQWEIKTALDSVPNGSDRHDADNTYQWSANSPKADGTVFTDFLASLNGACFAGHCDWRLPTLGELESLLAEPYPCTTSPCIDPIAGPTAADYYWSSTIVYSSPSAWAIGFGGGETAGDPKTSLNVVRAVRGGY
jgi:hypothetical protein